MSVSVDNGSAFLSSERMARWGRVGATLTAMTSFRRVLVRLLPLALSIGITTAGTVGTPAHAVSAQDGPTADPIGAAAGLQTDLTEMDAQRDAAEAAFDEARSKAEALRKRVERNEAKVAEARLIVGQFARTIYMSGPTDLSVMASMIDTDQPGDLVRAADEALRVGDHKDDQYDDAVELLRRNEEMKAAAESAEKAAEASLQSIENQMLGLRREIADGVDAWAKHLAGETTLFSAEQARLNSEAASSWADYLGQLADWRVPSISDKDLSKRALGKGFRQNRSDPGLAYFRKGEQQTVVLPERVVAAVTYAVSKMGTPYKWRANSDKEMDCSALVDRSWNIPMIPRDRRTDQRPPVDDGVAGVARRTRLVPTAKLNLGDLVFLADKNRGVNHVGVVVRSDLMIAADGTTGGVNAIDIPRDRIWQVGRMSLKPPSKDNAVPRATKKPFQCGADPRDFVKMPDGKVLANPELCPPSPIFGEGNMQPAAIKGGRCAAAIWPQLQSIGGWRPSDPYPDHPSGRAIDIMMPAGCSADPANVGIGNSIAAFFMQNVDKFDVQYMIWQQRIWTAGSEPVPVSQWRGMSNRGGCTANHQDHVHVSFNGPNVSSAPAPSQTTDTTGGAPAESGSKPATKNKPGGADGPRKPGGTSGASKSAGSPAAQPAGEPGSAGEPLDRAPTTAGKEPAASEPAATR